MSCASRRLCLHPSRNRIRTDHASIVTVRINEIFHSIQGEGKLAGVPSAFVRTSGCNLRCVWCDSPETSWSPVGDDLSIEQIMEQMCAYPTRHAVVTGGEPMIATGIEPLTHGLHDAGFHVTIETAATVMKDVHCDLASISPKLANSTPSEDKAGDWSQRHDARRIDLDVIRRFMSFADHQLKFVISDPDDLADVDDLLERVGGVESSNVLLMPEGVTAEVLQSRGRWLANRCIERGMRYCPRLHIEIFGHTPGT